MSIDERNIKEVIIRPVFKDGNSFKLRIKPEKNKTLLEKLNEVLQEKVI